MPQSAFALSIARAQLAISRRRILVGIFAVLALVLRLLGLSVSVWVFLVCAVWLGSAFAYSAAIRRAKRGRDADRVQTVAYYGDATLLTVASALIGGGWWMGATIYAFIVNFAFATLPRQRAQYIVGYTVVCFIALILVQATGVVVIAPTAGLPSLQGNYGFAAGAALFGATSLFTFAAVQHGFVTIMRRAQERYRILLQTAPDVILSTDRGGVIVSANEAARVFAASLGMVDTNARRASSPGSALMGRQIAMLAHPDDREALAHDVMNAAAGESRQREVRMSGPGADGCWFLVSSNPIREEDAVTGVLLVARDISAQKRDEEALRRSEEQLRQGQKMEAIGRLAGGVAHDFNNLLTVIGTYSELLLEGIADGTARREDVEEIYKATVKAASLTNQLLTFSRRQVLQPRLLNLNETVAGMESLLRRLIDVGIKIDTRLYPDLSSTKADPAQMEQVLLNLAVNARDAMPTGGVLRIETDDVFLDSEYAAARAGVKAGRYVLLSVSDTGTGMDEETRARIFEPFFTTKGSGEGTGLGLATVYGITQQSGGHIDVESELGRGTTFRIYLPAIESDVDMERAAVQGWASPIATQRAVVTAEAAPRPTARGSGETILLVEDGEALREVLQRVLEDFGYKVLVARDGEEALTVAGSHSAKIDLLVTDVVMPQMGGRELAVELWGRRPETRVLFMSGYTEDSILQQGLRKPTVGFIGKPFRPEALARKVREMLDRGPSVGPVPTMSPPRAPKLAGR